VEDVLKRTGVLSCHDNRACLREKARCHRFNVFAPVLLIFSKNMTTAALSVRYVFRLAPGEYGHGAKAIEGGSEEAVARWAVVAKRQGLRRGGVGRWCGAPDRVHVEGVAR